MEQNSSWSAKLISSVQALASDLIAYLPVVLLAALLLLAGWLFARFLRGITFRLVGRLNWLFHDAEDVDDGENVQRIAARTIAAVVFWTVMLSFVTAAIRSLGWSATDDWTEQLLDYAPVLIGGVAIIVFGFIGGTLVRQIIESTAIAAGLAYSGMLGRLSQAVIVLTGFVIGTTHLGLDVTFLVGLTSVLAGTITAGIALTLALGTRTQLSNLIAMRYLQKHYQVGEWIEVGSYRGQITGMADGYLFLETSAGDVSIPGEYFSTLPITKLTDEARHGGQ